MKLDDDIFDARVRAAFEDAEESVPAGIWEEVGKRIPSRRRPVFTVVRWAAPVAAAAAIVAGVVLSIGRQTEKPLQLVPYVQNRELALSSVESGLPLMPESVPVLPDMGRRVAAGLTDELVPQSVFQPVPDHSGEMPQSQGNPAGQPQGQESSAKQGSLSDGEHTDPFAALAFEDSHKSESRIRLTASYDASSNSNPTTALANRAVRHYSQGTSAPSSDEVVETGESRFGIPVSFGVGVKYFFNDRFSVGTGLSFTSLSRSFAGNYTRVGSDGTIIDRTVYSDICNKQRYIGIPVSFYYSLSRQKTLDIYAYAGGAVEKCISNTYSMSSAAGKFTMKEKVNGLQASVNAGLGMEFLVLSNLGLFFDPSLRYYFDCDQPKSIRTQQPFMMGFELGLRLRL